MNFEYEIRYNLLEYEIRIKNVVNRQKAFEYRIYDLIINSPEKSFLLIENSKNKGHPSKKRRGQKS